MRRTLNLKPLLAALGTALAIAVLTACGTSDEAAAPEDNGDAAIGETTGEAAAGPSPIKTPDLTADNDGADVVVPTPPAGTALNPLRTATPEEAADSPTATAIPTSPPPSDTDSSVSTGGSFAEERDLEIISILSRDAIPAIWAPEFLTAEEATDQMLDTELVIGLSIDGDHRAYSVPFLSRHEVVNDIVGGKPVAVTW